MTKIQDLAKDIAAELEQHQASITAAKTQLGALQNAHGDTLAQVDKAKKDLRQINENIIRARDYAEQVTKEAQARAGAIANEADKMNREAEATLAAAQAHAEEIIKAANAQAKKIVDAVAYKALELHDANNELNITQSKSKALKKQALDFGNS